MMYQLALQSTVFIASLLQGVTGFGFAIIAVPLLATFNPPTLIIIYTSVISLVVNATLLLKIHAKPATHLLPWLILGGLLGLPFGVRLLLITDPKTLKTIISFIAFCMAILYMVKPHLKIQAKKTSHFLTGLVIGTLQTSIGVNGPLLALYLNNFHLKPVVLKKTLACIFLLLSATAIPILLDQHILTSTLLFSAFTTIPTIAMGGVIGHKISRKIPTKHFRYLILILIMLLTLQNIT